jgi:catechol 2,3-dioxygenase-like lactoylglutathione lyase family enzyme
MINHVSLGVSRLEVSLAFYDAALGALGYTRLWTSPTAAGYGAPGATDEPFALKEASQEKFAPVPRTHFAFTAATREAVAGFHRAALSSGGNDDGPPGPRPQYGERYFAAFVTDPDGHRLEAVCHQ